MINRFLEKPELPVRRAAVIGLIRYGGLDGVLSSANGSRQCCKARMSMNARLPPIWVRFG